MRVSGVLHSKFSVLVIIKDQYLTLRNFQTGRLSFLDFFIFLGLPTICSLIAWWTGSSVRHVPEVLAAVAILTGLIFNVFVLLFDLTVRVLDNADPLRRDVLT